MSDGNESSQPRLVEEYRELEIDGLTIDEVLDLFDEVKKEGFTEVELCSGEYSAKVNAIKQRLETPEEVERRLKQDSWFEKREKEHFEYLRAKYYPHLVLKELSNDGQ